MIRFSPFAAFLYKLHPGFFLRLDARINTNQTWTTETSLSPSSSAIITGSSIYIENVGLTVTMTFTLNSDLIDLFKTADLIKSTVMMKVMLSTGSCNMDHAVSPIIKIHTWVQGCGVESWGSIIHFFCSIPLSLKAKYEFYPFNNSKLANWNGSLIWFYHFLLDSKSHW